LAVEVDELLPVDEAFVLTVSAPTRERIELHWQIADGYYLYRHRTKAVVQSGFDAQDMQLPNGQKSVDEFFGEVETYRQQLQAVLPGNALADNVSLEVHYQGCADLGVCYPPQKRLLTVALPVNPPKNPPTNNGGFVLNLPANPVNNAAGLNLPGLSTQALPLPAEHAFAVEAIVDNGNGLLLRFSPAPGYYLYRDRTTLVIEGANGISAGTVQWPPGQAHYDDHFGDVQVYFAPVEVALPLVREHVQAANITLVANFQGCQIDGICYPPMSRRIELFLPAGEITPFDQNRTENKNTADSASSTIPNNLLEQALDSEAENAQRTRPPTVSFSKLPVVLLLALLGGLILNLMPCVLPVLSLKVLSLAQSGQSRQDARAHALWYTLGVLSAFALIGVGVLALRAAGQAAGWGFQLQQPWFVGVLVYVMFAVGLSLSGVYTLGGGFGNAGQKLVARAGASGDFFTGVLACVVASPCIAPFMGPALAYAFTAPPVVALLVFIALGFGLALPFLLIGFVPALAQRLPKPGAWMETLKQVLAFPMYFTAIWLLWVLGQQRGPDAMAVLLAGIVLLALGLWCFERNRWHSRRAGMALAVALMALALLPLWRVSRMATPTAVTLEEGILSWSPETLARLRAENRVIFVNMTADWCITCKVNERNVLDHEPFRAALAQFNAVYLHGDWTGINPQISAFLEEHNAVGVPLYVVYGPASAPQVLPTILTQSSVERALQRAAGG